MFIKKFLFILGILFLTLSYSYDFVYGLEKKVLYDEYSNYEILDTRDIVSYINGDEVPVTIYYIKVTCEDGVEVYIDVPVNSFTNTIINDNVY